MVEVELTRTDAPHFTVRVGDHDHHGSLDELASQADTALFDAIRENISEEIELHELNSNINDPAFAQACAKALLGMLSND